MPKGASGTVTGDLYLILRPTPPEKTADNEQLSEAIEVIDEAYSEDVRKDLQFES
jgi:hypothetical protein